MLQIHRKQGTVESSTEARDNITEATFFFKSLISVTQSRLKDFWALLEWIENYSRADIQNFNAEHITLPEKGQKLVFPPGRINWMLEIRGIWSWCPVTQKNLCAHVKFALADASDPTPIQTDFPRSWFVTGQITTYLICSRFNTLTLYSLWFDMTFCEPIKGTPALPAGVSV